MSVIGRVLFFGSASVFAVGCQAPPKPNGPTERIVRVSDRDGFIDSMLTVLREHDFQPREVERDAGLALAGPSTSGQWFEFWRNDVRDGYQLFEASIHTIRRSVTVNLVPVSDDDTGAMADQTSQADRYRLTVRVDKERYSAPERQVTTASGALGIYSERLPTKEGLRGARSRGEHWVPLGRDVLLERYLLERFAPAPPAVASGANTTDGT